MENKLYGLSTISVTPFDEQGALDDKSLKQITEFYINKGVHSITILGILGEVHKLTEYERQHVIDIVLEQANGRVPVIVGCSSAGTAVTAYFTKKSEEAGASAVMIAPPQRTTNQTLLKKHFADIASTTSIPIVLQDEPVTTGVVLSPDFIVELAEQIPLIKYLKLEEVPTPVKTKKILSQTDKLRVFGGLGGLYYYEELASGAHGIMTGFSFPEILVEIYNLFTEGKKEEARGLFYKYLPLIQFESQMWYDGVSLRKQIYKKRNAIEYSTVRPPSMLLDNGMSKRLEELMSYLKLDL